MLAEPEREVVVRVAADVESVRVLELALVAVRRWVPQGDRVAGVDPCAAEQDVGRGGAGELHHRRRPAEDLLGRRLDEPVRVGGQPVPLLGVLEQGMEAAGDGVARGLVPRPDEQHEVAVQLLVGERDPIDGGVDEGRCEVVARAPASLGDQVVEVLLVLTAEPTAGGSGRFAVVGIGDRGGREHQAVCPSHDVGPVARRHADDPADRRQRHADRQRRHDVDRPVTTVTTVGSGLNGGGNEARDERLRQLGQVGLQTGHRTAGEARHREHPEVGVVRAVEIHHVQRLVGIPAPALRLTHLEIVEPGQPNVRVEPQDRPAVDEHVGSPLDLLDVVVAGDHPAGRDARAFVAVHRGDIAQHIPLPPREPTLHVAGGRRDVELVEIVAIHGNGHWHLHSHRRR
jgi:hypothetical protein